MLYGLNNYSPNKLIKIIQKNKHVLQKHINLIYDIHLYIENLNIYLLAFNIKKLLSKLI